MFQVGDKILYPMHGAGIIEAIEKKDILGEDKLYYIVKLPHLNMTAMIPKDNISKLGVREVVAADVLENVLTAFHEGKTDPNIFNDHKYCQSTNKTRLKSGDIQQATEIIRDLTRKNKQKVLGLEDKNILNSAMQILTSELMQVKGIAEAQAVDLLEEVINN